MTTDEHSAIATLFPGYFALVMATGIIAIGAYQQNLHLVANVLFAIAHSWGSSSSRCSRWPGSSATRGCSSAT